MSDATIEIELEDYEWLEIFRLAHKYNLTLNQFVQNILLDFINVEHGGVSCSCWGLFPLKL